MKTVALYRALGLRGCAATSSAELQASARKTEICRLRQHNIIQVQNYHRWRKMGILIPALASRTRQMSIVQTRLRYLLTAKAPEGFRMRRDTRSRMRTTCPRRLGHHTRYRRYCRYCRYRRYCVTLRFLPSPSEVISTADFDWYLPFLCRGTNTSRFWCPQPTSPHSRMRSFPFRKRSALRQP